MQKKVVVVGSGIVGLTTALQLQEKGFQVQIVSKVPFHKTLSHKVGAIWFPFEVRPIEKANKWAAYSYQKYLEEVSPQNGVSIIPFMVVYNSESDTSWTLHLPDDQVRKAHDYELPNGVESAFLAQVPLAEPPLYLSYLFQKFLAADGEFTLKEVKSLQEMASLGSKVVNCTGMGAKDLCQDIHLKPMRGQILRSKKLEVTSCVNSTVSGKLSYIINRSTDSIIGGTDYINDYNEQIDDADTQIILERLKTSGLSQKQPEVIEILVGLRPLRSEVRFEYDAIYPNIFHNYGHGGAGFTVAWGCAMELADRFKKEL